jgi:hypothetical protein
MSSEQRRTGWFVAAIVGGGLVAVAAAIWMRGPDRMPWQAEPAPMRSAAPQQPATPAAAVTAPEPVRISASSCPPQAAVPANTATNDGQFALEKALETRPLPSSSAFLAVAREAAQAGRPRDAEVALIAACRVAERQGGSHSVPVADLKSQLAELYLSHAAKVGGEEGEAHYRRASVLLAESTDAFAAALGKNASRTKVAERRLAAVQSASAESAGRLAPGPRLAQDPSVMGAARDSAEDIGPRSDARRLISEDPELAQLENDIGRLHAQASRVSRDPNAMRRRDGDAHARRDQCQDKACLVRWYAQRRSQLLNEF